MSSTEIIKRRDFIKLLGAGTAAVSTAAYAQSGENAPAGLEALLSPSPKTEMTMRPDKTGKKVSLLGYGGMRWPTKQQEGRRGGPIDQEKVDELIDYAMKHGVNYYDTAPVYHGGQSERAMGKSLSRYSRKSYYIATKLSNFNPAQWDFDSSKEMYENSFEQLGVKYIDFYLLHSLGAGKEQFDNRFLKNGMLEFLISERKKGRIKRLGFSFHGDRESFLYALNQDVDWDFVQIQLNYFDWSQDADNRPGAAYMYNELDKRGIPIVVMEPLLGGRLANLNDKLLAELKQRDVDQSPAAWAFRFVGTQPRIMTALSGMTYMQHLEENIRTFSPLKPLTEDEQTFLQETATAMMKYPTVPCTACRYCMPCPFNVDIPANFAYLNKCIEAGAIPASRQSGNYAKLREAFLSNFDNSVPQKTQSLNCTECKHCVPLCPQHIKIPEQMKRINQLVENLKNNTL
ncbi:MAG: aldo/keto reductase [Bacteroidaceae bacterium]|nr:aldo/keto reductase [Bacteroidaceae bacterium]